MAVGDIYQLAAVWNTDGNNALCVNRWRFRQETILILDTAGEDLIQSFQNNVETNYASIIAPQFDLQRYEVRGITDPTYGFDFDVTGVSGGLTGQAIPFTSAPIISWRTEMIGRANRGRTFLPPITEAEQDSGFVSDGVRDGMVAIIDGMLEMASSTAFVAGWQLGIWGGVSPTFKPVVSGLARPLMGTQRRRRPGTGA